MYQFEDVLFLFDCDTTRKISRVNLDEAGLLWRIIRQTSNAVVEIGSNYGGTTAMLAMALEGTGRKLYSIDIEPLWKKPARNVLEKAANQGRFEMIVANSFETTIGEIIGCLFIDGDHSFEGVLKDTNQHWDNVVKDGIIVFHDALPNSTPGYCAGVHRVVNALTDHGYADRVDSVRSTLVMRKKRELSPGWLT